MNGFQRIEVPFFVFDAISKMLTEIEWKVSLILTVCSLSAVATAFMSISMFGVLRRQKKILDMLEDEDKEDPYFDRD